MTQDDWVKFDTILQTKLMAGTMDVEVSDTAMASH